MRRFLLSLPLVLFLLAACLPLGTGHEGLGLPGKASPAATACATPSPQGTASPPTSIPTALIIPPTVTPAPRYTPRAWPAPFTYVAERPLPTPIPEPARPREFPPDTINILLMGSDRRTGSSTYRTDTLIILSIQPQAGTAVMLSIPRDYYVYLPGLTMNRVNTAYLYGNLYGYPGGGLRLLYDTIFYNLGISIDRFAHVEMSGFEGLIDALGGVDVRVTCPYTDWRLKAPGLNQQDSANWALFTVQPGTVHMNGEYALWYARSRLKSSDLDRARRQQETLRAIYRKILSLDLIPRLPSVYSQLTSMVTTDLSLGDLLSLAPLALRINLSNVRSRFIGPEQVTSWRTPTGASVLLPKPAEVSALLDEAFDLSRIDTNLPSVPVEIVNVSSHADWGALAAERLTYAGFGADIRNSGSEPGTLTHLIDFGQASSHYRERLLQILGLDSSAVADLPDASSSFAFRLVIGDDYKPCFNPTKGQGR